MNHLHEDDDPVLVAPDRSTRYRASSIAPDNRSPARTQHLLGVWAHPDDEAYLSAGVMARIIEEGGQVTLVAVTDGEGGFPADDRRPAHQRARQRRRELTAAMAHIGVTDVRFLGLSDGSVAEQGGAALAAAIRALLIDLRPSVVATFGPDGVTGHADHVHTSWAVTRAWAEVGHGDLWYAAQTKARLDEWRHVHDEFGIWMTGEPDGIDPDDAVVALDLTGAELDRKRAVLGEHRSQTATIATALGETTYRAWVSQEFFRRPSPAEVAAATRSDTGRRRQRVGVR